MNKLRPCLVVSPDELIHLATVIVAPLIGRGFDLPSRVPCTFAEKQDLVPLNHLRAVDKVRLTERLGTLDSESQQEICDVLQEMFAHRAQLLE